MIKKGDITPDFETTTENGDSFKLSDHRGKKVLLYFYPKDDTPGCTAESCSLRDSYTVFQSNDVVVAGISGGSSTSHRNFKNKFDLPFPLLMDEDFEIAKMFKVYKKKKMYGREFMGIERTTFLVDEEGRVEEKFGGPEGIEKVKTKEHADQVIELWKLKL